MNVRRKGRKTDASASDCDSARERDAWTLERVMAHSHALTAQSAKSGVHCGLPMATCAGESRIFGNLQTIFLRFSILPCSYTLRRHNYADLPNFA